MADLLANSRGARARSLRARVLRGVIPAGLAAALAAILFLPDGAPAMAAGEFPESGLLSVEKVASETVADGIDRTELTVTTTDGASRANLLTVDVSEVETGLIAASRVASNQRLDVMGEREGAIAALNADFFQISNDPAHGNTPVTGAPSGASIENGRLRNTAVPPAQRFGEPMPRTFNTGNQVFGVTDEGTAVVTDIVDDTMWVRGPEGRVDLDGLNQYGLASGDIVAFDEQWGATSRARAACGNEQSRQAACTSDVVEVIVSRNRVKSVSVALGSGQLGKHEFALVGREAGADVLAEFEVGDVVPKRLKATTEAGSLDWAVSGLVVVVDGQMAEITEQILAPRSGVGASADGQTMYLLAVDGRDGKSVGIRTREIADVLRWAGSDDAMLLDGGGSTTMLARASVSDDFELLSRSREAGIEVLRAIPNGIGVFPAAAD